MVNSKIIEATLIGWSSFGIKVVDILKDEQNHIIKVYTEGPMEYNYCSPSGEKIIPEEIAKRMKDVIIHLTGYTVKMMFKQRDEVWTKEKEKAIIDGKVIL